MASVSGVEDGSAIARPADPVREGYEFGGWFKDEGCANQWMFGVHKVYGDITLYAKWALVYIGGGDGGEEDSSPTYSVLFDSRGGTQVGAIRGVEYGALVAEPLAPTRQWHDFAGWFRDSGYLAEWDFAEDRVMSDVTLYAKWIIYEYNVAFDSMGGTPEFSESAGIPHGSHIARPSEDPVREGYSLAGWFEDDGYLEEWDFATGTVIGDMTLYAKWVPNEYVITYEYGFGGPAEGLPADVTVTYGEPYRLEAGFLREPYSFGGWYAQRGGGGAAYAGIDGQGAAPWGIASDVTAYAFWKGTEGLVYRDSGDSERTVARGDATGDVVVQEYSDGRKVTAVEGWGFSWDAGLTSVVLPSTVTVIGANAFAICGSLQSINIPPGVIRIDSQAFYGCSSLTSVVLPSGLEEIGEQAFEGCYALSDIIIPLSVQRIGSDAFLGWATYVHVKASGPSAGWASDWDRWCRGVEYDCAHESV